VGRLAASELDILRKLEDACGQVPGVRDPAAFNLIGQPNLVIRIDRTKAARYGISVGDLNAVVQAAIGGQEITRVFEGEMHFALTIRLAPRYRDNVDAIRIAVFSMPSFMAMASAVLKPMPRISRASR
jgi:cobalt-zinc-cadmium resistance protein CzcA